MARRKFEWKPEYELGIDKLDKEHQRLFKIINKLIGILDEAEKDNAWACEQAITYLTQHATEHFKDEEDYMEVMQVEGRDLHKQLHTTFREHTLPTLHKELKDTDYSEAAIEHFVGVCAGWLIGHTLTEDMEIVGKGSSRWAQSLPSEEKKALRTVLAEIAFDMFGMEASLVTDAYAGESIGRGVYYRMVYDTGDKNKRQEVLLAFEERVVINTVGKALGITTNRLDHMLMHASLATIKAYVQRAFEQFPDMEKHKLIEESLLTYEQFERIIDRETLQASFLLGSDAGYFGFCLIAPQLLEEPAGVALMPENAVAKIDEYLRQHEAEAAKPTVLIVDDSTTVRHKMQQLLEDKYEVALASSGLAAIRAIVLNKPDLVVLDYEMPVCDGRQTLEMLRTDEALKDTRVVFLTGKTDEESVAKVMELNPVGYLFKTMKPADIKTKIDRFIRPEVPQVPRKTVLIVDDSATVRHQLEQMLEDEYDVTLASSGLTAIRAISQRKPDLVVLDYDMPVCDGRQTLEMLRADEDLKDTRVMFLTGNSDPAVTTRIMDLNPVAYLNKNTPASEIRAKIVECIKQPEHRERKPSVLVVDDSTTVRHRIQQLLEEDYDVQLASSGLAAIRVIALNTPDLVLLDYEMPVCDGRQTLEMLRADDTLKNTRVVFLTGRSDPETVRKVKALNPTGYLLKTLKPADLKSKIAGFMKDSQVPVETGA